MLPAQVEGNDGAFPDADAWVGVFEPVRQTQRSAAAARVRVSERRILAKTDSGGEAAAPQAQGGGDDQGRVRRSEDRDLPRDTVFYYALGAKRGSGRGRRERGNSSGKSRCGASFRIVALLFKNVQRNEDSPPQCTSILDSSSRLRGLSDGELEGDLLTGHFLVHAREGVQLVLRGVAILGIEVHQEARAIQPSADASDTR